MECSSRAYFWDGVKKREKKKKWNSWLFFFGQMVSKQRSESIWKSDHKAHTKQFWHKDCMIWNLKSLLPFIPMQLIGTLPLFKVVWRIKTEVLTVCSRPAFSYSIGNRFWGAILQPLGKNQNQTLTLKITPIFHQSGKQLFFAPNNWSLKRKVRILCT